MGLIYHEALASYFFHDDFHWLQGARLFEAANLVRLDRYDHFYRPVVEVYFYLGQRVFGCAPLPFHLLSIGIHLLTTLVLFLFARTLTGGLAFASLATVLFAVQPGYVQAVAWIGAITDLLPALWYLLALWMHLLFLQGRGRRFYALSMTAFAICLLTHESSATLLVMMVALELLLMVEGTGGSRGPALRVEMALAGRVLWTRLPKYVPFAVLLAAYLALEYVVSNRSYLVREGHYALGWHAVPNVMHYLISLAVWQRMATAYVVIAVVLAALLVGGGHRVRFFVVWILVTLAPVSFFTWGNASRYLYLPAAGFALLLSELLLAGERVAARYIPPRSARALVIVVAAALAVRFAVFAEQGAEGFREGTRPYERLAAALQQPAAAPPRDGVVYVESFDVYGIPEIYVDPAAQTILCTPDVHVVIR